MLYRKFGDLRPPFAKVTKETKISLHFLIRLNKLKRCNTDFLYLRRTFFTSFAGLNKILVRADQLQQMRPTLAQFAKSACSPGLILYSIHPFPQHRLAIKGKPNSNKDESNFQTIKGLIKSQKNSKLHVKTKSRLRVNRKLTSGFRKLYFYFREKLQGVSKRMFDSEMILLGA